jgi:hypothetical protein
MMASIKAGIDFGKATVTQQEGIPSHPSCPRTYASGRYCPQPETTDEPNALEESSF